MSKRSSSDISQPATPDLPALLDNLDGYYIQTPLTWWEDGVCTIEDTTTPVIIGKIIKDHVGKSS